MFLAESLNQKLKSTLEKYELNTTNNILFPYTKPRQNPKVLEIQRNNPEITREQLQDMTTEEFLNKFSLQKLHKKWQRKFLYNYSTSTKKFSDECISKPARDAKSYIKSLLDRDIFESKIPRWNKSTKPNFSKNDKIPLKKTLFEVNHGFNNYLVTQLKEKNIEEGVESRDIHVFGEDWNVSNKLLEGEKKMMENDLFIKSMNNTQKYWRTKNYYRMNEMEIPISSERKQIEEPRYYKHYQSPRSLTIYNYEKMKKAKNDLWLEREKILKEEKIKNMGNTQEKINYLVEKRMNPLYKERFFVLTGKKKEINKDKKRSHWKDDELMDKIELVNNWKNTNWFKPNKTYNPEMRKREILKPLVNNKEKILKEKDRLKEEKINESKRKLKHDLMEQRHQEIKDKNLNPLKYSKYPINQNTFEMTKNNNNLLNEEDIDQSQYVTIHFKDKNKTSSNLHFGNYKIEINDEKLFLDAYKKVLIKSERNSKNKNKRNKNWIEYKFHHPGIYREFKYKIGGEQPKEEKFMAWSCCNNSNKNAKGCQKIKIDKHKWNFDSI